LVVQGSLESWTVERRSRGYEEAASFTEAEGYGEEGGGN